MRFFDIQMDEEQLDDFVASIIDAYEAHLGYAQDHKAAVRLTQDATIATLEEHAVSLAVSQSEGNTKH